VLGSLEGRLEAAFTKLATLHSKNNFSLALVTGNLFSSENGDSEATELLSGKYDVPLPTYFTVGSQPLPADIVKRIEADEDICANLHYLGKRSVTKTSDGLRIVTLGGQLDATIVGGQSTEQHLPFHTSSDAKSLRGANAADILLTTVWPAGIWRGSQVPFPVQPSEVPSTEDVSELVTALRPRYHFAASPGEFFFEREPFVHPQAGDDKISVTRFISMAPYGNASKAKGMYAFTLQTADTTVEVPLGSTASPFTNKGPKKRNHDEGFNRFSSNHGEEPRHSRHNKRHKRRASPPPGPDKCFFCLSNPNLPTHMVCSVGNECYIATAKGPLPTPTTFADQGLTFPGHFIIIPLPHNPTIASMGSPADSESDAVKTHKEMIHFRDSLQAAIAAKSGYKLGAITWEISRASGIHLHWQFLAAPADMIRNGLVAAAFRVEAENMSYPSFQAREMSLAEQAEAGDFFRLWIWADDGEDKVKGESLVMQLDPDTRFDLQYPRRVMSKLLGLEDRLIWRDCVQTEQEEIKDVEAFRTAFSKWDFTLQDQ
jgi:hypothetical protein